MNEKEYVERINYLQKQINDIRRKVYSDVLKELGKLYSELEELKKYGKDKTY